MVSGPTNFFSPIKQSLFSMTALAPSLCNILILVTNLYEDKIELYNAYEICILYHLIFADYETNVICYFERA